jgi:hypothetical protein
MEKKPYVTAPVVPSPPPIGAPVAPLVQPQPVMPMYTVQPHVEYGCQYPAYNPCCFPAHHPCCVPVNPCCVPVNPCCVPINPCCYPF